MRWLSRSKDSNITCGEQVDAEGNVLDILMQRHRDPKAAQRFGSVLDLLIATKLVVLLQKLFKNKIFGSIEADYTATPKILDTNSACA